MQTVGVVIEARTKRSDSILGLRLSVAVGLIAVNSSTRAGEMVCMRCNFRCPMCQRGEGVMRQKSFMPQMACTSATFVGLLAKADGG